jgi:hypothetical protein
MGILGMIKRPMERQRAIKLVNGMIVTFAVFFILTDVVLGFAALS